MTKSWSVLVPPALKQLKAERSGQCMVQTVVHSQDQSVLMGSKCQLCSSSPSNHGCVVASCCVMGLAVFEFTYQRQVLEMQGTLLFLPSKQPPPHPGHHLSAPQPEIEFCTMHPSWLRFQTGQIWKRRSLQQVRAQVHGLWRMTFLLTCVRPGRVSCGIIWDIIIET